MKECVERLFEEIGAENLRIGITAHGDYCDRATYVTKHLPLTTNVNAIVEFVENVQATYGGDAPEAYELVLHEAQDFAWMDGWMHVLVRGSLVGISNQRLIKVLIGDDRPHEKNDPQNDKHLDWKEELDKLKQRNIVVHGVQALNRQHASSFYAECARRTGGCHLALHQFNSIIDLIMAVGFANVSVGSIAMNLVQVCYRESARHDRLEQYEQEIQGQVGRYSRAVRQMFDNLLGRENVAALPPGDMNAVNPGRFQVAILKERCHTLALL